MCIFSSNEGREVEMSVLFLVMTTYILENYPKLCYTHVTQRSFAKCPHSLGIPVTINFIVCVLQL